MTPGSSRVPSTRITLLLQIRQPDCEAAWQDFVDLYTPMIYAFAKSRGYQEHDCLDIAQETLLQVSRSIDQFDSNRESGSFRGWLGTIAFRVMTRLSRRQKRATVRTVADSHAVLEALPSDYETEWHDHFRNYILQRALQRIRGEFSDEVWHAFEATWLRSETPAEVARELERSVGWIYQAKFQVIRRLEREVEFLTAESLP